MEPFPGHQAIYRAAKFLRYIIYHVHHRICDLQQKITQDFIGREVYFFIFYFFRRSRR